MDSFASASARPDRYQYVAAILLLATIPLLAVALGALDMPRWAWLLAAMAASVPPAGGAVALGGAAIQRMREGITRRERRFRNLLESAPDAIVIVDQRGRIVLANDQTTAVFGYKTNELVGQSVEILMPESLRATHEGHRAGYFDAPSTRPMGERLNLMGRRKDGSVFAAEISLSPLDAEEGMLATAVIRDVTERRRLEDERQRLRAEAEAERTRQRMAMDLHDGIIQSIYAVGLNLEAAADDIATNPGEVAARIDRAIDDLNDTIGDIRAYIMELRPARFSGEVAESLTGIAHEFRVNSLIETTIDVTQALPPLTSEGGSALFHIAKEALNNIRRHSRATSVEITLRAVDGAVQLDIADNGAGFDQSHTHAEQHNGLRNMASRARTAGGTLNIESTPRAGTRIRVEIPGKQQSGEPG
ncbi:MAG: PAS domain S-box protein [Dehalococcoidia bacterium]|nr:MAG: PAS domain S-box protein [Dehalococcoidia bacterium]